MVLFVGARVGGGGDSERGGAFGVEEDQLPGLHIVADWGGGGRGRWWRVRE